MTYAEHLACLIRPPCRRDGPNCRTAAPVNALSTSTWVEKPRQGRRWFPTTLEAGTSGNPLTGIWHYCVMPASFDHRPNRAWFVYRLPVRRSGGNPAQIGRSVAQPGKSPSSANTISCVNRPLPELPFTFELNDELNVRTLRRHFRDRTAAATTARSAASEV